MQVKETIFHLWLIRNKKIIPDGIRTRNLKIRSLTPYPLGHGDIFMISITWIYILLPYVIALVVQWLEFVPSKHEVRVRFPANASFLCFINW
jgi:hypothetical protein